MTTTATTTVPLTTQLEDTTQSSQSNSKIVIVHHDKMTERQQALMKECQNYVQNYFSYIMTQASDLTTHPTDLKVFLIPNMKEELIGRIRKHFKKPIIILPRAIIEKRDLGAENTRPLPTRSLVVSLTMYHCKVFLVQSCNIQEIKDKILEMGGTIVSSFKKSECNVVVTDKADNKYCARAFKRNIPVVKDEWVYENYCFALDEDDKFFRHNALTKIDEHKIKPFFGLKFQIDARVAVAKVKDLIVENQGSVIYGKNPETTHIVLAKGQDFPGNNGKAKCVDVDFLQLCARCGYYLRKREYRELVTEPEVTVKEEVISPSREMDSVEENNYPRLAYNYNHYTNVSDNGSRSETNKTETSSAVKRMLPPPSAPQQLARPLRQQQQQPDNNMDDMILKAMSTLDTVQTQQASTQMRRLPDQELQIEQTIEPSQALWWNDKRN